MKIPRYRKGIQAAHLKARSLSLNTIRAYKSFGEFSILENSYWRTKLLFIFISVFVISSCDHNEEFREEMASHLEHEEFRKSLVGVAPQIKKVNFSKIIGRVPSKEELHLGRMLFNDTILSRNNDVSCATCHLSNHGFADGNSLTVGAGGQGGPSGANVGKSFGEGKLSDQRNLGDFAFGHHASEFMFRNSLSTINTAYRLNKELNKGLFWDGRFGNLQFQVLLPIHTAQEMCGTNPIVKDAKGKNIFRKNGPIFKSPVKITHTNSYDEFTGLNTSYYNGQPEIVYGIPFRRKNGKISIPNRNECLALAVAKVSANAQYRELFKKAYNKAEISDRTLSMALQSFILTHTSNEAPYDEFMAGRDSMSKKELEGLVHFLTPLGSSLKVQNKEIRGMGCISCHDTALFGGNKYEGLGVKSDLRSSLSKVKNLASSESGFFDRARLQKGLSPSCHIEGVSASASYGPDIGHAVFSLSKEDCFKFRVPSLRNVVETFPYFHHGSSRLRGRREDDPLKRSLLGLTDVVEYHLTVRPNLRRLDRENPLKRQLDPYEQADYFIPYFQRGKNTSLKNFTKEEVESLVHFIAFALWDKSAVKVGALNNDISHPVTVPSGLSPSITRDDGTQLDGVWD